MDEHTSSHFACLGDNPHCRRLTSGENDSVEVADIVNSADLINLQDHGFARKRSELVNVLYEGSL